MKKICYLEKLQKILLPGNQVFETGSQNDWEQPEGKLNIKLPDDYKKYINIYGSGVIDDFLWVLNPFCKNENINLLHQSKELLEACKELRQEFPEFFTYNIFPEKNGLLPWGLTDNGDELYWKTDIDLNKWEIVVFNGGDFYPFQMCMTEFLYNVLSGKFRDAAFFPDSFPSENFKYKAIEL